MASLRPGSFFFFFFLYFFFFKWLARNANFSSIALPPFFLLEIEPPLRRPSPPPG